MDPITVAPNRIEQLLIMRQNVQEPTLFKAASPDNGFVLVLPLRCSYLTSIVVHDSAKDSLLNKD